MKFLVWFLSISVLVYWAPRVFLNFVIPCIVRCEAVEILPGVYKLGGLRSRVKNVYALTKGPLTIIDPGLFSPVRCIDKSLRHIGYRITDIKFIVATHYHIDHIGSVGALRRKSGAQVIAHELDAPFIEGHRRDQYPHAPWHLKTALLFVDLLLHDYVSKVDIIVRDSQHLTALGDLEIIHTPGHTPGHMCLLDRPRKILFSGDAVQNFDGRITRAKEIYSDDLEADMESLRRLTEVDFVHVLPGDGQPLLHEGKARVARYVKSLVLNP